MDDPDLPDRRFIDFRSFAAFFLYGLFPCVVHGSVELIDPDHMYVFSFPVFPGSCFPPHRKTSSFFLLHGCFLNTRERFLLPHGIRLRTRRTMPTVNYIRRRFHLHPGAPRLYKGREHVSTAWSPLLSLPCRHHRCRSGPVQRNLSPSPGS